MNQPEFDPNEKAEPRVAWGRRAILIGALLLMLDYALHDRRDYVARFLADQVTATGEIKVPDKTEDRTRAAFQKAKSVQQEESTLKLIETDDYGSKFEVTLLAPNRDLALTQLDSLLAKFRSEYGDQTGQYISAFSSPYVAPVITDRVAKWCSWITFGLLGTGLGLCAIGAWLCRLKLSDVTRSFGS